MDPGLNLSEPNVLHIDLNSCFATIEQQANRRWRNRPVAVTAYNHPNGIVLAASYEAKAFGIKLGTRVKEARQLCPDIYITEPDPPKYREAHRRFREVLETFTSDVTPKSIDEFVINVAGSPAIQRGEAVEVIGHAIKQAVYERVGKAVHCNVGAGPNRFLAKLAAGLHKPNGLDIITAENLETTYAALRLTDLPGISRQFNIRLRLAGIYSPLEFLHAPRQLLCGTVFHGVTGHYWWLRLRGWEIDAEPTKRSQIGHRYAIPRPDRTPKKTISILAKLCEKAGRRLRSDQLVAHSLNIELLYADGGSWGQKQKTATDLFATQDIYQLAQKMLASAPKGEIARLGIALHNFTPADPAQLSFFDGVRRLRRSRDLATAMDTVNDRWGGFTIQSAAMLGTEASAKDAIAFGSLD